MLKRLAVLISVMFILRLGVAKEPGDAPHFQSSFMRVELAPDQPAFTALAVDSLGTKKLTQNPLRAPAKPGKSYELLRMGRRFEYRPAGAHSGAPVWSFEFSDRQIKLSSFYSAGNPPPALLLDINPHVSRATLLGLFNDDGSIRLPALLHLPNSGTFRITSPQGESLALGYDAFRHHDEERVNDALLKNERASDFVKVSIDRKSVV